MSSELARRVLTALVALPLLFYAAWAELPHLFNIIAAVAILLAVSEFYRLARLVKAPPFREIGYAASFALIVVAAVSTPERGAAPVLAAMTVALMVATLARAGDKSRVLVSAGATALGVLYVAFLGSYLVAIRALPSPGLAGKLLTLFFVTIMAGDIGAYFAGRALGRHKLAPRISPGKTVEGAVGGVLASVAAALVSKYTYFPELPVADAVALGVVMNVFGQVGDLCESLLKRGSNVKDSSTMLPGHGGFLDRLDSLLLNAPVLYYYYVFVLAGRLGR